jgi:deoxyribodipyrimidine photo-lyase
MENLDKPQISLFWFRRDLRLNDNTGLYHALREQKQVQPIFIFDSDILNDLQNPEDRRVSFILNF